MSTAASSLASSPASFIAPTVPMDLSTPPEVANLGRGTHGVVRRRDEFRLPELWSLHLYSYRAELEVDGVGYSIWPGAVSLVPPATVIRYRYGGPSTHLFAHLRSDAGSPSAARPAPGHRLRMIMSPGAELPMITDLMSSAIAAAPSRPARARADLWSVLLRLDELPAPDRGGSARRHLGAAVSYIESRLPDQLSVPEVAEAVGVSTNHLARVFAAEGQPTVVAYIRRRRVEHARRLLATTTMSIGAVAASVGFADLQAFNKACRTVIGVSPRQLRRPEQSLGDRSSG